VRPKTIRFVLPAILLLTLLIFVGSLDNEFVHDDWPTISENPYLQDLGNVDDFFVEPGMFAKTGTSGHTRPVLLATFALNFAFDAEPRGFRAVNLALHLLNVVLVYLFARSLLSFRERSYDAPVVGLLAAAVFAVHPLNVQAVIYISSRSVLLSFAFYLSAVLLFLRWRRLLENENRFERRSFAGLLVLTALALLTKEHTVSIAGVLVLLEVALFQARRRNWRRLLASLAAGGIPVALLLVYRAILMGSRSAAPNAVSLMHQTAINDSFAWHLATQAKAQLVYLGMFLWPSGLAIQHTLPPVRTLADPGFLTGALVIVAASVWALPRWWRGAVPATLVLWYFCTFAPESLVQLNMIVNEHRFYLPGLALIAGVAWGLVWIHHRVAKRTPWAGRTVTIFVCAMLLILAYRSWDYTKQWKTACTLWEHTAGVSPGDSWTQNNAGNCRLMAGDLQGAATAYERAIEVAPDNHLALYNLGMVRERQGRLREAIEYYERFEERAGQGRPLTQIRMKVEMLRRRLGES